MKWFDSGVHQACGVTRDREAWLLRLAVLGVVFLAALGVVFLAVAEAVARPGGGESYRGSSGRSSGSGGGGGSGGEGDIGLIIDLIVLCVRYPALGAFVVVCLGIYFVVQRRRGVYLRDWSVGVPQAQVAPAPRHFVARATLDRLRHADPHFSVVVFEDFLFTLYAQLQMQRAVGLDRLSAYVDPAARATLRDDTLQSVTGVLIGTMRYLGLSTLAEHTRIDVEVEANLTETRAGKSERLYIVEQLALRRAASARSRPPERAHLLDCPSCGAALEAISNGVCSYCKEQVSDGRFDWQVTAVHRTRTDHQPPLLTATVEERGLELPSVVDPGAQQRLQQLSQRDPQFQFEAFQRRVHTIFSELQVGWSSLDRSKIRPYVSDNLFQYFSYWLELYGQAGWRNVTENARILRLELTNTVSDAAFDAITLRLYATGLDYTQTTDGRLLSGSRTKDRPFSEYWTLIRGQAVRGVARSEKSCPNCGAPLNISMAGQCEYCRVKVVSGDFDWVLSRIEQDDSYNG